MVRRATVILLLVGLALMGTHVTPASADATLHPDDDTYVRIADPTTNFDEAASPVPGGPISVTATGFPLGSPKDIGYLRFDLSGWSGTITGVRLRLWDRAWPGIAATIAVLDPGSDDWNGGAGGLGDETTLIYNNAPSPLAGTALASQPGNSTNPGWVEFSDLNGFPLTTYVQNQVAGDNIVTFALRVTSTGFGDVFTFEDRENTEGTGHPPELILEGDLAVELEGLAATRVWEGVRLDWRTVSEHKHAGFRVLREATDGRLIRLTPSLIRSAQGFGELGGSDYQYVDRNAPWGATRYWIEDVDITGQATRHGPVVAPNVEFHPLTPRSWRSLSLRSAPGAQ